MSETNPTNEAIEQGAVKDGFSYFHSDGSIYKSTGLNTWDYDYVSDDEVIERLNGIATLKQIAEDAERLDASHRKYHNCGKLSFQG